MEMINNNAIGESWKDVKKELFSSDEIMEIEVSAALMSELIEARHKKGISQKRLEELSGAFVFKNTDNQNNESRKKVGQKLAIQENENPESFEK